MTTFLWKPVALLLVVKSVARTPTDYGNQTSQRTSVSSECLHSSTPKIDALAIDVPTGHQQPIEPGYDEMLSRYHESFIAAARFVLINKVMSGWRENTEKRFVNCLGESGNTIDNFAIDTYTR